MNSTVVAGMALLAVSGIIIDGVSSRSLPRPFSHRTFKQPVIKTSMRDSASDRRTRATCKAGQYQCNYDLKCIDSSWLCDGKMDCIDGLDETNCGQGASICSSDYLFTCSNKLQCIHTRDVCDGFSDCLDGSDETSCDRPKQRQMTVVRSMSDPDAEQGSGDPWSYGSGDDSSDREDGASSGDEESNSTDEDTEKDSSSGDEKSDSTDEKSNDSDERKHKSSSHVKSGSKHSENEVFGDEFYNDFLDALEHLEVQG